MVLVSRSGGVGGEEVDGGVAEDPLTLARPTVFSGSTKVTGLDTT